MVDALISEEFEQVYLAHYKDLYRFVFRYVLAHEDTENIVQEVFLEFLGEMVRLPSSAYVRWLYQKARNKRRSYYRTLNRRKIREKVYSEGKQREVIPALEERDLIRKALASIPPDKADLIELCHLSKLSDAEVALRMGLKESSVPKLLSRAEVYFFRAYQDLK